MAVYLKTYYTVMQTNYGFASTTSPIHVEVHVHNNNNSHFRITHVCASVRKKLFFIIPYWADELIQNYNHIVQAGQVYQLSFNYQPLLAQYGRDVAFKLKIISPTQTLISDVING